MLLLLKDFGRKKWMPLSVGKVANVHAIGMGRVVHQVEQTRMLIMALEDSRAKGAINSIIVMNLVWAHLAMFLLRK